MTTPTHFTFVQTDRKGVHVHVQFETSNQVTFTLNVRNLKRAEVSLVVQSLNLCEDTVPNSCEAIRVFAIDGNLNKKFSICSMQSVCCAAPNCKLAVHSNHVYCTKYHYTLEFLHQQKKNYNKLGDAFGSHLAAMILNEQIEKKEKNKLQPVATFPDGFSVPKFSDNCSLVSFYMDYIDILLAPLRVLSDRKKHSLKKIDQMLRAEALSFFFKLQKHSTIRLMDGHCGLLIMFLNNVRNLHGDACLNGLTIELVDIEPSVTMWHSVMYPCPTVKCLTEQIVDNNRPLPASTMLYMNFCGVSESFDAVRKYLKAHKTECVFSFSTSRKAAVKDYGKSLISLKGYHVRKLFSPRNEFETWVLCLTEADMNHMESKDIF